MRKLVNSLLVVSLSLYGGNALSQEQSASSTFEQFSSCDASFFKSLNQNSKMWADQVPLKKVNGVARIDVPNRLSSSNSSVKFKRPVIINGVGFQSYYDEYIDLGSLGKIYNWGFEVDVSIDEAASKLMPLIYDSERLTLSDGHYARTEVKVLNSPWVKLKMNSGVAAGLSRTERAFFIERDDEKKITRITCSIQGGVTPAILKEVRPDIEPKDYPIQISENLFEETQIPAEVMTVVNQLDVANSVWKPKFKTLTYSYLSSNPKKPSQYDDEPVTVQARALPNGLIQVKEIYNPQFTVDRLLIADMIQLKSRLNGLSDGRVYLTTHLSASLPKTLSAGQKIQASWRGESVPKSVEDDINSNVNPLNCELGTQISANTIHPELKGYATKITCNDQKGDAQESYFLNDYGMSILSRVQSKNETTVYQYTQFLVDR